LHYAVLRDLKRAPDSHRANPAALDRDADFWLSVGRHDRAEQLSHAAEALRQTGADRYARQVVREVRL